MIQNLEFIGNEKSIFIEFGESLFTRCCCFKVLIVGVLSEVVVIVDFTKIISVDLGRMTIHLFDHRSIDIQNIFFFDLECIKYFVIEVSVLVNSIVIKMNRHKVWTFPKPF